MELIERSPFEGRVKGLRCFVASNSSEFLVTIDLQKIFFASDDCIVSEVFAIFVDVTRWTVAHVSNDGEAIWCDKRTSHFNQHY